MHAGRLLARFLLLLAVAVGWSGGAVRAQTARAPAPNDPPTAWASAWAGDANAAARLTTAASGTGAAGAVTLAVVFRLAPGWHIYWVQPGESGAAPEFDWSASDNLAAATPLWPTPRRFTLLGLETVGYAGPTVTVPLEVQTRDPAQGLRARLNLFWLACSTICVPYQATLALETPAGPAAPTPAASQIATALAQVPQPWSGPAPTAAWEGTAQARRLRLRFAQPLAPGADLFVERPNGLFAAQAEIDGATLVSTITGTATETTELRLVAADGAGFGAALTLSPPPVAEPSATAPTPTPPPPRAALPSDGWIAALAAALLGGLLLNVMPCVLPVLSLKLLAVTSLAHAGRREARQGFLFSAAGIVASFALLAALAVGLKAAGVAVGWGMQFQQPVFLAALAGVCGFFAANLWGWIELSAPEAAMTLGALRLKDKRADAFFGGVAATALATPCSAPFVGTAVGFALAGGAAEIVTVFLTMGVGLAAPHLLIAAFPDLAARLPRPGRWMLTVRALLGVGMALTCAWLLWSLAGVAGEGAAWASGGAVIVAAGLLALRRFKPAGDALRKALGGAAVLGFVAAAAAPAFIPTAAVPPLLERAPLAGPWRLSGPEAIAPLLAQGKIVFVDVTADWCLTCKVNKAAVLDLGEIARRLADPDVAALRFDWTRPNPAISAYLAGYGRYGVPFNVVYGPARPDGVVLPELLTESAVEQALAEAAGARRP